MAYAIEHYPTRWIDVWRLPNGQRVTVRPVLPQDAALEQELVRALSPLSRYQRFFAPIRELPSGWPERLTQIDYRLQQALLVETFVDGKAKAVAEARYVVDASGEEAEFAVLVADEWQRQGLARRLMDLLLQSAAEAGLQRMAGDVLATNRPMLSLARGLGFDVHRHPGGGAQVLRVERDLEGSDPAAARCGAAATAPGPSAPPAWAAT
jgi:acetyltransferase